MNERSSKAFWAAFWSGIAAPGLLYAADDVKISRIDTVRHSRGSDIDAMRSDWIAIGKDFDTVIRRETAPAK